MHPQPAIHELLSRRWSPVAFSSQPIEDDLLASLFEAARWAPSCFNAQPWRFIIGRHGSEAHARILSTLTPGNSVWAANAYIVGITVARESFSHNGKPNKWAAHDVGLASMSLAVEATARGLFVHFMAGFDAAKAVELLGIPEHHSPVTAFAIGHRGDAALLPPEVAAKDSRERTRKPLSEVVVEGTFGSVGA